MSSSLHILMLEDQPEDAALIDDELRRGGLEFSFRRVDTREAFVRELRQNKPDLILSDHGLPSFDGMSALEVARRACPDVPFIFVTGSLGEEFAIRGFENGATDYVLKHNIRDLAPAVRRAVEISDQRRNEREQQATLRRDEECYRMLVESVKDYSLYMLEPTGQVATWNAGAESLEGFAAGEAIGRRLDELFPAELANGRFEKILRTATSTGRHEEEGWRTRRDGRRYWANTVITAIRDERGQLRGFAKVARDLTERRNYIEALQRGELRMRAIIETALDAVIQIDADGTVQEWNSAAERMFGHKREEALDKTMAELIIPPYLRDAHRIGMARYLAEGTSVVLGQRFETVAQRVDGTELNVELAVTEVPTEGTRLFTGYISDITERKRTEEQMRRFNLELEQQVAKRTEQLEAANKELEAFSYSVSHDLRAPLRHINGFVELLQGSAADTLGKEDQALLKTIADSARHMGKLIDDLLNFSRMGRTELRFVPIQLENVIQEAVRELRHEIEGRNVRLHVHPLPVVNGDPVMLRQAFINLLSNALKYSRDRNPALVEVFAAETAQETIVSVRDNGVGFDPAYAHKLFGVFQRLHSPQEFEGTGIGLAIVRRVIARHDGRVWAEGEVDKGATFNIALPREPSSAAGGDV